MRTRHSSQFRRLRLERLELRAVPATWDGGGADNNWMTPENWVGDVAPVAGDDLVFPAGPTKLVTVNNFPADTAFNSIAITNGGYQLTGNPVALVAGVTADFEFSSDATIALNLAGTGGLTKAGHGRLILSGNNSYLGPTTVQAGFLRATTSTALGAPGAGNETIINAVGTNPAPTVELVGNGLIFTESFTLGEFATLFASGSVTINGPITLTGAASASSSISVGPSFTDLLTITSGIGESGGSEGLNLDGGNGALVFAPTAVNTYTGTTNVAGTVVFNGQATTSPIVSFGGTVAGAGTLGSVRSGFFSVFTNANLGGIQPGTATTVGTLTTGNLNLDFGGILGIDMTPAAIDRVVVNGTVQLSGYLNVRTNAFSPVVGAHYRIIDNDGADAVNGNFVRLPEGTVVRTINHVALRITYHGGDGNDVELVGAPEAVALAVGADAGGLPVVHVYGGNGALLKEFLAYDSRFTGGVRVATGDVTGDGIEDIVTAPGAGGGPDVRVFDGVTYALVREFNAYNPVFTGGVFVAAGDLNGDNRADIITGAGMGGGPHVQAFNGVDNVLLSSFLAYDPRFIGGVSVAAYNGGIVTGPGPGGGPDVRFFGVNGVLGQEFNAFDPAFRGGVYVGSSSGTNGTSTSYILVGAGAGGGPHVKAFFFAYHTGALEGMSFLAYDPRFTGGVRVAGGDLDGDGIDEVITGAGPGGGPHVEAWHAPAQSTGSPTLVSTFFAFDPAFIGGIFVG